MDWGVIASRSSVTARPHFRRSLGGAYPGVYVSHISAENGACVSLASTVCIVWIPKRYGYRIHTRPLKLPELDKDTVHFNLCPTL